MAYEVERSAASDRDLETIFDFLFEAALALGEDASTASERAARRILEIEAAMEALGDLPHQGVLPSEFADGLRGVMKGRSLFYFDVDDMRCRVRVLAIFFGGRDHRRRMLLRLLSPDGLS
jgi:toxin ParE1/3/4